MALEPWTIDNGIKLANRFFDKNEKNRELLAKTTLRTLRTFAQVSTKFKKKTPFFGVLQDLSPLLSSINTKNPKNSDVEEIRRVLIEYAKLLERNGKVPKSFVADIRENTGKVFQRVKEELKKAKSGAPQISVLLISFGSLIAGVQQANWKEIIQIIFLLSALACGLGGFAYLVAGWVKKDEGDEDTNRGIVLMIIGIVLGYVFTQGVN